MARHAPPDSGTHDLSAGRVAGRGEGSVQTEFLANVSHELRTPMNAVIGMIELSLGEDLPPLAREYLVTARDSSRIMLSLVNDLLDLARMESGRIELDCEPFRLRRVLEDAMRSLSLRAHERGIELACDIPSEVPDFYEGDGRRLRQIVSNLVGNSLKFTEQGEVVVRLSIDSRHGDVIQLHGAVSDTGIGISPADQQRIFAPFTQADASTTRRHSGAGLGLAIARELVERMDGRIWLESSLGHGATFHFTVLLRTLRDEFADGDARVEELRRLPVLIVDDNATNRHILHEMLAAWSMAPISVDSGRAALARVKEAVRRGHPIPLIIIDALMPDMDGFTLVEAMEREGATESATVLMLSSADRQTFEERCSLLPIDAYLEKPVSQSMLLDAVMTALQGPPTSQSEVERIRGTRRPLSLLVAEDTPANQKVVRAILSKRGHSVCVANNGREALEMHKHDDFDAILMDVQMPTMDGIQATAAIRELGDPRKAEVPVIAMTAHAMAGDRVRCLRAGMTCYISKPIDAFELIELVERTARPPRRDPSPPAPGDVRPMTIESPPSAATVPNRVPTQAGAAPPAIINIQAALQRMGGDDGLLRDMARFFLEDAPRLVQQVRTAAQSGHAEEVARHAHSLKGLAANFDATDAQSAAASVERFGLQADMAQAVAMLPELERQVERVSATLRREALAE